MTKNGSFLESLPDEDDDFDGLSSIKSGMLENVENLVLECNGDVRSLMFSLQLLYARIVGDMYAKRKKNEKKNTKKRNREEARIDNADGDKESKKESSISLFHALGKFLYAKRKPSDDAL